jgi:ABC-type bacteriocin/lantibiotic exporter with double-glycine peptidase domain
MIGERCADLILAAFLVAATCPMMPTGRADESVPSATATYDCGTLALYNLLRLEGHPTDLATLESRLSSPSPRGHSMQQLRDAARSFGLDLIGVRLSKRHGSLDRPALVFLKEGHHGHFLVIRPIGQTGKLIQMLDSNRMPDVVDAADLFASPRWTGLALIPDRPNWSMRAVVALFLIALTLPFLGPLSRLQHRAVQGYAAPRD